MTDFHLHVDHKRRYFEKEKCLSVHTVKDDGLQCCFGSSVILVYFMYHYRIHLYFELGSVFVFTVFIYILVFAILSHTFVLFFMSFYFNISILLPFNNFFMVHILYWDFLFAKKKKNLIKNIHILNL